MKPYYRNKFVTLYHRNCLEVIPQLNMTFDCCITDPPFGNDKDQPWDFSKKAIELLSDICAMQIIITDWRNGFCEKDGKFAELIWQYGWLSGGRCKSKGFFPTHNTIHFLGARQFDFESGVGSILLRRPGFSSPRQCSFAKKTGHPYEKPIKLMVYLITRCHGMNFIDPFAGSGTTGVAAMETNKKCVLIEKEEKYCQIIADRLERQNSILRRNKFF